MEWWEVISLLFGSMVLLLLTGLPVAFSFLIVNMVGAYFFLGGTAGLTGVVTGIFTSITTFTLLPVPLFIFMGGIIFHSGLGLEAVNALDKWLGRVRGRLSILAVMMGIIIGALSGSTIATCALLGTVLLPEMLKKGYSKSMSLGPLMGVGSVDALIPPNALTVVLASIAGMDVGRLLIAGILPGLFMSALYVLYIVVACTIYPHLAPEYEVSRVSWGEKIGATLKYLLPLGFIVFMVVGLIFLGVATPTEAAATGAFGSFILALLYGRMKWEQVKKSILGTVQVTVMIFMIIIVSNTYSEILAFTGSAFGLVDFITGLEISPTIVVVSMMFTILILGCFMETVAIMMITIPIIKGLGGNPVVIPSTEVYVALERNVVDGYCWPAVGIRDWGWQKLTKYVVEPGFYQVPNPLIMNLKAWNNLPKKFKDLLTQAAIETEKKAVAYFDDLAKQERPILLKEGLQVIDLPAVEKEKFLNVAYDEGWKDVIGKNPTVGAELKKLLTK